MNNEQQYIDQLYAFVFAQRIRCTQLSSSEEELNVLMDFVSVYKQYYEQKAEEILTRLHKTRDINVGSYLTYDKEFYVTEYNARKEEVELYLKKLPDMSSMEDLSVISPAIDKLFAEFVLTPTLFSHFKKNEEKKDDKEPILEDQQNDKDSNNKEEVKGSDKMETFIL